MLHGATARGSRRHGDFWQSAVQDVTLDWVKAWRLFFIVDTVKSITSVSGAIAEIDGMPTTRSWDFIAPSPQSMEAEGGGVL